MKDKALALERLRYYALTLGMPAFLGLCLALLALGVDAWGTAGLEEALDKTRQKRSELRKQFAGATGRENGMALQLDQLPDRQHIDSVLAALHASAAENQVMLEQGEYRLQAETGTRLARYRVVLPARGSYVQIRSWLDAAAESQPGLQIDELSLKREDITQEAIEARVSFSLLVRMS